MHERSIAAIWLGGIILALAIYVVGPDRFVWGFQDFIENFGFSAAALIARLGTMSFDLLRALAIALFVVFVGLSVVAVQRGVARRVLILVVVGGFLALTGRPGFDDYGAYSHRGWVGAFFLAAIGAAMMTRRLTHRAPPPRGAIPGS
jgi:hypothetical protein